jgi:hypothetical protein
LHHVLRCIPAARTTWHELMTEWYGLASCVCATVSDHLQVPKKLPPALTRPNTRGGWTRHTTTTSCPRRARTVLGKIEVSATAALLPARMRGFRASRDRHLLLAPWSHQTILPTDNTVHGGRQRGSPLHTSTLCRTVSPSLTSQLGDRATCFEFSLVIRNGPWSDQRLPNLAN